MAKKGRPKRSNPKAERQIFKAELESCPVCDSPLTSTGSSAHSRKTVQTFSGEQYVVAYSRLCDNSQCQKYRHHYHAVGHLGIALPSETYGLDIIAFIGWQRDKEQRRFSEIHQMLNQKGVQINERSVGRLYRLYHALLKGGYKKVRSRLAKTEQEYGGLVLASDGLKPDGCGGTLYVLYEVLGGTPVAAAWQEVADTIHLTAWLQQSEAADFKVLATMSDHEEALVIGLSTVWSDAKHQLCQEHFISGLSKPIHEADQQLQAILKKDLRGLPKPPELKGELKEDHSSADQGPNISQKEKGQVTILSLKKNDLPRQEESQSQKRSKEPMLANLLFPQQPALLFDRQNGLPIPVGAQLWDKYYRYYRRAVQDALRRSRRKPFQLGGVAGYDQLVGILSHLEQRQLIYGPDQFLSSLESRLRQAIKVTTERASDIRQARAFLQKVEHLLAHSSRPTWHPQSSQSDTTSGEVVSDYSCDASCETEEKVNNEPKYKVGEIATACIKEVWQFLFRPIRAVHFRNGRYWYLFEGMETGYCEDDVLLASAVGKRAEGLFHNNQSTDDRSDSESEGELIARGQGSWHSDEKRDLSQTTNSAESSETSQISSASSKVTMDKQENASELVKKELLQMFKTFSEQAQLGVTCKRLHGKWQKMRQTWLPGILYCYEIAGVPRNNLELEAVYGKLRANQRRISGRKETSPLRLFGAGEVMALMIDNEAELLEWCQTVAQDKQSYRRERRLQEEREEQQRWLWRLHRNPIKAMSQVDEQFYATLKKLGLKPTSEGKVPNT